MTPEDFRYLIPGYLSGRITLAEKASFEEQLRKDPGLRIELAELQIIWDGLGSTELQEPSATVRARFYQRLQDVKTGQSRGIGGSFAWWKPGLSGLVRQATMAVALFFLGVYAGRENWGRSASTQQVAQLHSQVQELRQTVALSLLDRQSATSRLEGVSWSMQVDHLDSELLTALVYALNHDQNTNVRLASLDALEKFTRDPAVRKALVDSIRLQNSPLVQIALIDSLVHIRDRAAEGELRKLSKDSDLNAAVQERARWGLEKLTAN